eukprot:572533-Lingulodinium_polyedra.AAC.1
MPHLAAGSHAFCGAVQVGRTMQSQASRKLMCAHNCSAQPLGQETACIFIGVPWCVRVWPYSLPTGRCARPCLGAGLGACACFNRHGRSICRLASQQHGWGGARASPLALCSQTCSCV